MVVAMRLDAHLHFWRYDPVRDAWITREMGAIRRDFLPADLAPVLGAHRFDGCVAVEAAPSIAQTQFLLELAHANPFIRGVVGWVDVLSPDLERTLERLHPDPRLVGIRYGAQGEPDDFLARDDVARGVAMLGRFDLAFDILIYERQLPAAITLATRLPEQTFVLDHIAKPRIADGVIEPWASRIRELARRPNVSCKVSGMITEADWRTWRPAELRPYLDVVFDAFGPNRLVFGSDWPVCLVAGDYARVVSVVEDYARSLTVAEREALFGGTAARAYGLSH